jgi:hypothetical protein
MKTQIARNETTTLNQNVISFPVQPATKTNSTSTELTEIPANLPFDFGFRKVSAYCLEKFNDFKETLTSELAEKYSDLLDPQGVRYAVSEADAIAAFTAFPALFLPVLAEEKVQAAAHWNARQRDIRARSLQLAA